MRVGIFLQDITPESGGAFTFAETVLSGLVNSGIPDQFTVFHYGSAGRLSAELEGQLAGRVSFRSLGSCRITRFFSRVWYVLFSGFFQTVAARFKLPYPASSTLDRASRRAGTDLIWFPTPSSEPVECPYIFTVWDLEHRAQPYFPEMVANGVWNTREKYFSRALKRASYVITGTEVGKREICGFYGVGPDRVHLLPHPTPRFALEVNQTFPLPERLGVRSPYVIYPAQFWAHKNHIGLIEALVVLRDQGIRVDCALVGSDKGNRKFVEDRVRELKLEEQVHFLGFVSREDLVALYQNALALVYPSLCGPENLPPLEAMALGCPVIAADIEGAKEQLSEAAVLVRATDASAVASAIRSLVSSSEKRAELSQKGKSRAKRYTEKEFTRDLTGILDEFRAIRKLWAGGTR